MVSPHFWSFVDTSEHDLNFNDAAVECKGSSESLNWFAVRHEFAESRLEIFYFFDGYNIGEEVSPDDL